MAIRRRIYCTHMPVDTQPIVRLWLLRLLVPLGGHHEFVSQHGFSNDTLAELIGLGDLIDHAECDFDSKSARTRLRRLHLAAERALRDAALPSRLSGNVTRLSTLVGLSEVDCQILSFAVVMQNEQMLNDTADLLGPLSSVKMLNVLSVLLDIPEPEIRGSLSTGAILARSGLVSIDRCGIYNLRGKLELLSASFADTIYSADTDPIGLLRDTVSLSAPAQLDLTDYAHITPSLSVLRPYLARSIATRRLGVNILLHGCPGTGKSQLARALAQEFGCELFEVASEDEDGDPVAGERRLRAFRAAQSFLARRRALILFDEIEDVFNDGDTIFGRKSTAQTRKAWINRTLEENPVPTLWLSNSIECIDRAFIRRFDMVFELPVPPKQQRERILAEACSDLLDAPALARIADSESLAPAVITRAASVVRSIRDDLGPTGTASAFELLVGNTLLAQGNRSIRRSDPNRLPEVYDPHFIHADSDLTLVSSGLLQTRSGRLCLYGPPGTGKTAYGRWLAEQLGVSLTVKRASDLMSMWVGGNEKNIAHAFQQAEHDGSVLLIDEVDSFLQDRRVAQRGWEASLVNEMLTQMESFAGVFVATTNLMDGLDQAALRRFDLKVRFDFLRPDQACDLLRRHCRDLSIASPPSEHLARLMRVQRLTPGDFAAVVRQSRLRPLASSADLIAALEVECALKEHAGTRIGFIQ